MLYPAELRGRSLCFKPLFLIASSFCCLLSLGHAKAAGLPTCFPQGGFETHATAIKTAREIEIGGKDVLLLAGIEIPEQVSTRAIARVGELTAGKSLRYAPLSPKADRYGRIPAEIAVQQDPALWLQGTLVEEGLALAMPIGIKSACANDLMSIERQARAMHAGLWSQPGQGRFDATKPAEIRNMAGRFALIEGKILSVGARDYASFLNFGRDYKQDFAVIVLKKIARRWKRRIPWRHLKASACSCAALSRPGRRRACR